MGISIDALLNLGLGLSCNVGNSWRVISIILLHILAILMRLNDLLSCLKVSNRYINPLLMYLFRNSDYLEYCPEKKLKKYSTTKLINVNEKGYGITEDE